MVRTTTALELMRVKESLDDCSLELMRVKLFGAAKATVDDDDSYAFFLTASQSLPGAGLVK